MYCNFCGKVIQNDANHCAYCGKRVGPVESRHRLLRPNSGKMIGGVCAAFAEYFDLDVALIRVVWVLVAIFGGTGVLAYLIAWIVIPAEQPKLAVHAPENGSHAQAS